MSDYTQTPNLHLYKPTYDADDEQWGYHLNANADTLDAAIYGLPAPPQPATVPPLMDGAAAAGTSLFYARSDHVHPHDTSSDTSNVQNFGAKGDGLTDDTGAFINAIAAAAGKTAVYVPQTSAAYMVTSLALPSNTHLVIDGTIRQWPGATQAVLTISGTSNVWIEGCGTVDANHANAGIMSSGNASNIRIEGITIQNANLWNLNITQSSHVRVNNVQLLGGVNANEFAAGCNDCQITNSLIDGVSNDGGFVFYGGITNSSIIGCVVRNQPVATAIAVYADTAQPAACANIVIANNTCYAIGWGGIAVNRDNTVSTVHTGITITGNRCYNNNHANVTYGDIWVSCGVGVTVSGNTLGPSGNGANPTYGVFVGTNSSLVTVSGNTISNEGQGGTAGSGVYIQAANDVFVGGNLITDNQTTKTMASAISGNAGARNVIGANEFGQFSGAANQLVLASDTVVQTGAMIMPGGINGTPLGQGTAAAGAFTNLTASGTVSGAGISTLMNTRLATTGGPMTGNIAFNAPATGINYRGGNAIAFDWSGSSAVLHVDGGNNGNVITDSYAAASNVTFSGLTASNNGVHCGSHIAPGGNGDVTTHLDLYGGGYGACVTGNRLNFVVGTGAGHYHVINNVDILTATAAAVNATVPIQRNGVQVVNTQITGWGTPTGGARTASFNGASATLAQTSAVVAQLILDLKTHGLLGA